MDTPTFAQALSHTGIPLDGALESFYNGYRAAPWEGPLVDMAFLDHQARRFGLGETQLRRLHKALEEIDADPVLAFFTRFLVRDMCSARHRCDLDDYRAMAPDCMTEKDLYSFLLLLSCVPPSMKRLEQAGVPAWFYRDIPFIPMKKQFEKLEATGDGSVEDFPWDMNFYTCSIFFLDRFYFIPYRLDENIRAFRNRDTGRVLTFYAETVSVRRDGQLDGVNGIHDADAWQAVYTETDKTVAGCPISPAGLLETRRVTLEKAEWEPVLQKGDILLGTHIPGGPGYTPERLQSSLQWAGDFFDRYFPEIPIKGFGSESWLYDPHLRLLLKESSNIVRMQDQMYIYPIESGGGMLLRELFEGSERPTRADCRSSLQYAAVERLEKGKQFTACSMFILRQDVPKVGSMPYGTAADRQAAVSRLEAYDRS